MGASEAQPWRLAGEYLESCNCEVLCPCIVGPRNARGGAMARPTEGYCDVPVVFAIERGVHGDVTLDGLAAAIAAHTPGAMGDGGWTMALYLDERADPAQRAALETIFGGAAGGPPAALASLVATRLPTRVAPIRLERSGRRRTAGIPGVLDVELEGLAGADGVGEIWLDNVRHFVARRLAVARAARSTYTDHGLRWNHAGRNGHYASFSWSGP